MNATRDTVTPDSINDAIAPDHSWNAQVIEYHNHGKDIPAGQHDAYLAGLEKDRGYWRKAQTKPQDRSRSVTNHRCKNRSCGKRSMA